MIYSYEIEKRVLSGILQNQDMWGDVAQFLEESDFYSEDSKVHSCIFKMLRSSLNNSEAIDDVILIDRLKSMKISFPDDIDVSEYVMSLTSFPISSEVWKTAIRDLKKISARRTIYHNCREVAKFVKTAPSDIKYSELVEKSDKMYHNSIKDFELGDSGPIDLFAQMEEVIEERGNNPIDEVGLMGPYPRINELYGSLLLAGNITVIVARSGVGKSTFAMDYTTKVGQKYNVPVLHFDNGEMSPEELIFRQCSALSGVPTWLLQTGHWRTTPYKNWSTEEVVHRVRSSFKKVKNMKFYYENVAGMSSDEMSALLKRFYYAKVGRAKDLIFSFDYIKSDFGNLGKADGWAQVGRMVDKFKQTIHKELVFDNKPYVSMFSSVQSNRLGITNNRSADNIVDDESVVALSDAITHFCSHLFLLRKKVAEEMLNEGAEWGTHKLINLKARHLGKSPLRAIELVELPDGSKKQNFINLKIESFNITEVGDLHDWVESQNAIPELRESERDALPRGF